jgi:hypothetical protein
MSRRILLVLLILALATLACGVTFDIPIQAATVGPEETEQISVDVPQAGQTSHLSLGFGAGKLSLSAGAGAQLVNGTATYNIPDFKPTVKTDGTSVHIEQGNYTLKGIPNFKGMQNEWDLKLGEAPIDLAIQAGAYNGEYDFGGLSLTNLTIQDGASDVNLTFSSPNQSEMTLLRYETGASNVKLTSLGNADFSTLIFKSGAGDYTLDFGGQLKRDGTVTVDTGLSNLIVIIPEGIPAQVTVEGGLANISTGTGWGQSGKTYTQSGSGPSLTFVIKMGAGNLTLSR